MTSEILERELGQHLGAIIAKSALIHASRQSGVDPNSMKFGDWRKLLAALERSVRLYIPEDRRRKACIAQLSRAVVAPEPVPAVREIPVRVEADVVTARNAGRDMCKENGFSAVDQVRVATAISELARNIVMYAPPGVVLLAASELNQRGITITARDSGKGIPNLDEILAGQYTSHTGMGRGLLGVKNLMDTFSIRTGPGGTEVVVEKHS